MVLVSADGHTGAPPNAYREYIEPKYVEDLDRCEHESSRWATEDAISQSHYGTETLDIMDEGRAIRDGGELGAWEMDVRVRELDREGIAGELLLPGHQLATLPFFGTSGGPAWRAELRAAGARAYHRWLADQMAGVPDRFLGVADASPCLDIDAAVRELQWVADHGFVSVAPPGQISDPDITLPPLYDAYYEPFWATCAELGFVLTAHVGYGFPQGAFPKLGDLLQGGMTREQLLKQVMTTGIPLDTRARRVLPQLMLGGVLDRYPTLKVVLTELRSDWVPGTIAHLDRCFEEGRFPSALKPSEYFERQIFVTPSSPRRHEIAMRHEVGVGKLMYGMDYPHPEGTWPNTWDWIRTTFEGVPEDEARLILGETAIACYGFDGSKMASIAERIGPMPADVLGDGHQVTPRLIETFHNRSGYAKAPELVDTDALDAWVRADAEGLALAR
jgi:predicted TIM-barrel fold metal-dependent hydrolase